MQHPSIPIAQCFLNQENDNQNVCHLYTDKLVVRQKGKTMSFAIDDLKDVNIKHKKLLFPLITGGLTGTFFMIAAFNFRINIWLSLSLSGLGYIALYMGWQGSHSLSISTSVKEFDFFISQNSKQVYAFSEFIKEHVLENRQTTGFYFYLPFSSENWKKVSEQGELLLAEKTHLLSLKQINALNPSAFLRIDLQQLSTPIFMDAINNIYVPYLKGKVNLSSVEMINL